MKEIEPDNAPVVSDSDGHEVDRNRTYAWSSLNVRADDKHDSQNASDHRTAWRSKFWMGRANDTDAFSTGVIPFKHFMRWSVPK